MIEPQFRHDQRESAWIEDAACLDEDPELFFPVGTSTPALAQTERAKGVCRLCAVRTECLGWALDTCQDAGVWGGLDEEERRIIRRRRRHMALLVGLTPDWTGTGRSRDTPHSRASSPGRSRAHDR